MVMSRVQNARQSHNIKINNNSFERLEQFKRLETTLMNQNSIQEEIKIRMKLENAILLLFGAESFVFLFAVQIYKRLTDTEP
jgi:hypothetical protein